MRVSKGFRLLEMQGNCIFLPPDLVGFPCINSGKPVLFKVGRDEPKKDIKEPEQVFQPAQLILQVIYSMPSNNTNRVRHYLRRGKENVDLEW